VLRNREGMYGTGVYPWTDRKYGVYGVYRISWSRGRVVRLRVNGIYGIYGVRRTYWVHGSDGIHRVHGAHRVQGTHRIYRSDRRHKSNRIHRIHRIHGIHGVSGSNRYICNIRSHRVHWVQRSHRVHGSDGVHWIYRRHRCHGSPRRRGNRRNGGRERIHGIHWTDWTPRIARDSEVDFGECDAYKNNRGVSCYRYGVLSICIDGDTDHSTNLVIGVRQSRNKQPESCGSYLLCQRRKRDLEGVSQFYLEDPE